MHGFTVKGDYIDGRWISGALSDEAIERFSPADLDDRVGVFPVSEGHVDLAVEAARRAQPAWESTPLSERMTLLRRFAEALKDRSEAFVEMLGREVGKPVWEAKTEVNALASKVDITLKEGLELVKDYELENGKFACRFRPHGVLAVLGPFNFPLHLPNGHIVPALVTGNTVVFKPSELTPGSAQLYLEAAEAAGFPPGVLNLVQGRGASGARLGAHEDIDGVLFTGSSAVGKALMQANIDRPGRMLALELGGKNAAVVLADAPFEKALHDVLFSACVTAGQRCSAVSRVIVERPLVERFIESLAFMAPRLKVGHPKAADVFMGPLVSEAALAKFLSAQKEARAESEEILASRPLEPGVRGHYVSPAIHRVHTPDPRSRYQHEEIFGPDIAVYAAEDLEHAAALADESEFGLAAAVFTEEESRFEALARRLHVGVLAWNAPSVGSSSRLPFGGLRKSGNQRPAGAFSTLYCTHPLAITRGGVELSRASLAPGMEWKTLS